jgi:hypothetical protein
MLGNMSYFPVAVEKQAKPENSNTMFVKTGSKL